MTSLPDMRQNICLIIYAILLLQASHCTAARLESRTDVLGTFIAGIMSMIIGLGTDITDMTRIRQICDRFGNRFFEKILTPQELKLLSANNPTRYIAGRFAAKEAAVKALGTGFSRGIGLQHIEITRTHLGQPQLHLLGPALKLAEQLGIRFHHVSISHERNAAIAVVIFEA